MTNSERIQANNAELQECLELAESLPNAGSGGNATWAGLPDKPVVMVGGDTLTWDGNTEGKVSPMEGAYKVSNAVPTLNDFSNGLIAIVQGAEVKVTASEVGELLHEGVIAGGGFFIVPTEIVGTDWNGIVFPEAGTYFVEGVCSSLTIPGYTGFEQEKIAPSHLWQPDWNQNDSSKPDYIKNRPFGETEIVILEEQEVFISPDEGIGMAEPLMPITDGMILKVTFNGTAYETNTVFNPTAGMIIFGNSILLGGDEGNEEPFCCAYMDGVVVIILEDMSATSCAVKVESLEITKIPAKYVDTQTAFYISTSDKTYVYKDAACTVKATLGDVKKALSRGVISVQYCLYGRTIQSFACVNAVFVGTYYILGTVEATYYTAEYTGA